MSSFVESVKLELTFKMSMAGRFVKMEIKLKCHLQTTIYISQGSIIERRL